MDLREAQYGGCFQLSLGDALDTATIDFRKVCRVVDDVRDDDGGEAVGRRSENVVGGEIYEDQLEDQWSPPHDHDVAVDQGADDAMPAHAPLRDQQAEWEREQEGEEEYPQRGEGTLEHQHQQFSHGSEALFAYDRYVAAEPVGGDLGHGTVGSHFVHVALHFIAQGIVVLAETDTVFLG